MQPIDRSSFRESIIPLVLLTNYHWELSIESYVCYFNVKYVISRSLSAE